MERKGNPVAFLAQQSLKEIGSYFPAAELLVALKTSTSRTKIAAS
jgi:hypothetical protein